MKFKDILDTTKFSTKETVELLKPLFEANGKLNEIYDRNQKELLNLKQKYPDIPDINTAISIMKSELTTYAQKIVETIKKDYRDLIPKERISVLENLLNPNNIVIINNPEDGHDFSADPEKGQVIINVSQLSQSKDFYSSIINAKGTLPHEIFHIIIKMLKSKDLANDRMIINLINGDIITSRGMVGFILNEGFVEKISNEFCEYHEKNGEDFFHTIAPQYIPYVNICNYLMNKYPNINYQTIFSADFEECLSHLTEEEKKQYLNAECISYAVRHKKINPNDILTTRIDKIQLDTSIAKENQLKNVIDTLSKLTNITEEQKEKLLTKYLAMTDDEVIKDLAKSVYRVIGSDSPFYNYALAVIRNLNPTLCPSVEEMKESLNKMFSNQIEGNMPLDDNHKLVKSSLTQFCSLFNQYGIDYYIVGALPCFLKTKQPLFRYHDDIDIMVNENDIPKIAKIIGETGYKFYDDRFPTIERFNEIQLKKPPHTILAQNPENEFHLGFFCFKREQDNSITVKEYSHRLDQGEVITDILERRSTPMGTALSYDETPIAYNDVEFKTSSIESVYKLKSYTKRPKDITDMKKLEPFIDKNKLSMLSQCHNENVIIKNANFSQEINLPKR